MCCYYNRRGQKSGVRSEIIGAGVAIGIGIGISELDPDTDSDTDPDGFLFFLWRLTEVTGQESEIRFCLRSISTFAYDEMFY